MGSRTARTRARSGHDRIAPAQKLPFRADYLFLFILRDATRLRDLIAPAQPVTFRTDHPFLFLLRDTASGAILFAGRFEEPTR